MAEKKFLVDLNLTGNKAKNFRLEDYADNTAPTSNFVGRMIYTTTGTDRIEFYNGSSWVKLAHYDELSSGSVTSVGLALDTAAANVFGVSNSPITSTGDITLSLDTQSPNYVFAGPATGGTSAAPTFRALVAADIPSLSSVYQPLDADLTSIAGLAGTTGFLKKTAANTFTLDTSTYLTSFTETDPVFVASVAYGIDSTDVSNWDTAYGWGNHASAGYAPINNPVFTGTVTIPTSIVFEGATANDFETTLTVVDPTVDRTITLPNADGTVALFDGSGNLTVPGNLTVSGDTTTLNTATLTVEDNLVVLNSNVTGVPTLNAGIEIERGDYTNASLYWDETSNAWYVATPGDSSSASTATAVSLAGHTHSTGDITGLQEYVEDTIATSLTDSGTIDFSYTDNSTSAGTITAAVILAASNPYLNTTSGLAVDLSTLEPKLVTDGFAKKYSTTIGDAAAQTFAVTHSLGTRAVTVSVYETASPYAEVEVEVLHTSTSVVTINTNNVPTSGQYTVVVVG
jgi:hypothetical protein